MMLRKRSRAVEVGQDLMTRLMTIGLTAVEIRWHAE
jgi:hypothetical protein